jgi:hypothetical protein
MKHLVVLLILVSGSFVFAEDGVKDRSFQITGLTSNNELIAEDTSREMQYSVKISCTDYYLYLDEKAGKYRTIKYNLSEYLDKNNITCNEFRDAVTANVDLETFVVEYRVISNRVSKIYTAPKQVK